MIHKVFDAHCDTLCKFYVDKEKGNIINNNLHFSYNNCDGYDDYVQVLAFYANPFFKECMEEYMRDFVNFGTEHLKKHNVFVIKSKEELMNLRGRRCILCMEGADAISSEEDIVYYYNKGVRVVTITWNSCNKLGNSAASGSKEGLTDFGKDAVKIFNKLGILADVSHLNEQGFYDTLYTSEKPVIASHSNCDSLCGFFRNLSDNQLKALIEKDGVCGINFCCDFLNKNNYATIDDIIKHIEYVCALGGKKNVGLGSDFDGIPCLPSGLKNSSDMYLIAEGLLRLNYNEKTVEDIMYNNMHNLFKKILK